MRILLLEDEVAIASALSRSMRRWGHEVLVANCCAEARKLAADKGPEALLSDLKLPDGSGTAVARELGLPFILMSGFASFDDAVEALRLGGVDFLTKPVALADLRSSLGRLADRFGSWEMCVIEPGTAPQLCRPAAASLQRQRVSAQELRWSSREQAEVCFRDLDGTGIELDERRLIAELLQCAPAGRLVINRGPTWWRAWLDAALPEGIDADRRLVIESIAQRCILRADGMLVEWSGDDCEAAPVATVVADEEEVADV